MRAPPRPTDRHRVLELHRVRVLWRVLGLWAAAVGCIFTGMVGTGLHLFAPPTLPETTRSLAGLIGWPAAVLGPTLGIMGIVRVLAGETRAVLLCADAVRFEGLGPVAAVPWAELVSIDVQGRWPRRRVVVEAQRSGARERIELPDSWFGLSAEALCDRVREMQRRALLGAPPRSAHPP